MIRDAVIHLMNEQPIVVDLTAMPVESNTALVCTNVRTLDGRRPVFVDRMDSVFVFPYHDIRFIEIPREPGDEREGTLAAGESPAPAADDDNLEIDEAFLERVRKA